MRFPKYILIIGLVASFPALADQYLCVANQVTGFKLNGDKWESIDFHVNERKYLVVPANTDEFRYLVKEFDSELPFALCSAESFEQFGFLYCEGISSFYMSKKAGRYLLTYSGGYWTGDFKDTPHIEIGKCSPL